VRYFGREASREAWPRLWARRAASRLGHGGPFPTGFGANIEPSLAKELSIARMYGSEFSFPAASRNGSVRPSIKASNGLLPVPSNGTARS